MDEFITFFLPQYNIVPNYDVDVFDDLISLAQDCCKLDLIQSKEDIIKWLRRNFPDTPSFEKLIQLLEKDWIKLIKIQYRKSTKRGYVQLHFYILDHHKRGNYYRYITIRPKDTIKN